MASSGKKHRQSDGRPARPQAPGKTELKAFVARARELAEPALARLGLELVAAQCPVEGGQPVLRLFIDRLAGSEDENSRITLDDCSAASRAVEAVLEGDGSEPAEGYLLEVSSPGLDRPLVKPADYPRFAGRLVKLKLRRDGKSLSRKGRLAVEADGGLALETAEGRLEFILDEVTSCRLSLDDLEF